MHKSRKIFRWNYIKTCSRVPGVIMYTPSCFRAHMWHKIKNIADIVGVDVSPVYSFGACVVVVISDRIFNGWHCFGCTFYRLNFTTAKASWWLSLPGDVSSSIPTRDWLAAVSSCIAPCDWLKTLVRLHCDVMIGMSTIKTWCFGRSFKGNLTYLQKKIPHQNAM